MMSGMFPMSLSSLVSSNPKITITFVLAGAGAVACYLEYLRRDRNGNHFIFQIIKKCLRNISLISISIVSVTMTQKAMDFYLQIIKACKKWFYPVIVLPTIVYK